MSGIARSKKNASEIFVIFKGSSGRHANEAVVRELVPELGSGHACGPSIAFWGSFGLKPAEALNWGPES